MMTPMDNNNKDLVETYGGVYDKTDIEPPSCNTGTGPVDHAFIQISDQSPGGGKTTTSSPTGGAQQNGSHPQEEDSLDGFPLKRTVIQNAVKHIHRRAWSNVGLAALRNLLTWACIISFIIIMANARSIQSWNHSAIAAVVCVFGIGLIGIGFHIFRSYLDLSFKYPTVIGKLIRDAVSREEFLRIIQNRQMSPPEISVEVSLKSGAMSNENPSHWTRSSSRKTRKELNYRSWADQSSPVGVFKWPEGRTAWVVVAKDFRSLDRATKNSIESEVAEFRRDSSYDNNKYYMNIEYLLQWKESDSSDDAEMILVFEDIRPGFYFIELYKACTLIALDSVYRLLFHIITRNLDDYYITKFVER